MEFRILGSFEARDQDRPLPLGGLKQRAVLAILLLHAGEVVPVDRLIDELWGDEPPASAPKTLQAYVSRLRSALGESGDVIETRAGGYAIHVRAADLDLARFERLAQEGRRELASGSPERGEAKLRDALATWRGPALADFTYENFAQTHIARLEAMRASVQEDALEAGLATGRHAELVGELEALIAQHPLRERPREQLMLALYRSGRQAEALEAYRDARRTLVEEQGIEPGERLRRLEQAVLAQDDDVLGVPAAAERKARGLEPPPRRRRRRARTTLAGLAAVGAAVVAAAALVDGSHEAAPALTDDSNAVAAIDPEANDVVGATPVGVGPGPIAFEPRSGTVWVANQEDRSISHIDSKTGRAVRTIAVAEPVSGLAAADGVVWVGGARRMDPFLTVRRLNARFDAQEASFRVPSAPGTSGALSAHGREVWIAPSFGRLVRATARTRPRGRGVDTGRAPTSIAAGRGVVWVADASAATVARVDRGGAVTAVTPVRGTPTGIAVGDRDVWVSLGSEDAVARVDGESGAVRQTIEVGRSPAGIAVGAGAVWVANAGDGTVSRIDPATGRVVGHIAVGGHTQGIAVGGNRVWVSVRSRATGPEEGAPGGTVRVVAAAEELDFVDPALAYVEFSWQLLHATCAKLLNYPDAPAPAGSRLQPEVASSLPRVSRDGRTYTFTVRQGYRFSPPSGEPVTALTFKRTIERSLDRRIRGPAASFADDIVGARAYSAGRARSISGVEASGRRLTIRLTRPSGDFAARLALPFFCAVPSGTPVDPEGIRTFPSAGPYFVSAYTPGQEVVLKRNPNYAGQRPQRPDEIRVALGVGSDRAVARVADGEADYVVGGVPEQAGRLRAAEKSTGRRHRTDPSFEVTHLALNTSRPAFRDVDLRRAVNYAVDRTALAQAGALGGAEARPTDQHLPFGMPGFRDTRVYPFRPDLVRARALMGERRPRVTLYTMDDPQPLKLAGMVAASLRRARITVRIRRFPPAELFQRLTRRNEPFDMALVSWIADAPDPANFLELFNGAARRPDRPNHAFFDDPAFNRRLARAARLSGPERYATYGKLDIDLARRAPWAPLSVATKHSYFSERVGCPTYQPVYGISLAALCVRR